MDDQAPPAAAARIDYESPDKGRPNEFPAVWRVAWWAGLLWAVGTVMTFYETAWRMLAGQGASESLASRQYGMAYAVINTGLFLVAALLIVVLVLPVSRRVVAWVAAIASAVTVVHVACAILLSGGINGAGPFAFISLFCFVLWTLTRGGGVMVTSAVALWPERLTASWLAVLVAIMLCAHPVAFAADFAFWYLSGDTIQELLREAVTDFLPWNIHGVLMMLAALVLIIFASRAIRLRWPFTVAAALALLAVAVNAGWGMVLTMRYGAGDESLVIAAVGQIAQELRIAAPAIAWFAWRPPDAASAGGKLARAE